MWTRTIRQRIQFIAIVLVVFTCEQTVTHLLASGILIPAVNRPGDFFMERIKDNKVIYNLRAETMRWDTAVKKWQLTNAVERFIDSMGERFTQHTQFTLTISLKPHELRKDLYMKDKLTTPELVAFIKQEELRGTEGLNTLKVERYRRTATPAAVLLLTIIGAVIASRRTRGGSGMHLASGYYRRCHVYFIRQVLYGICHQRKFPSADCGLVAQYCFCSSGLLALPENAEIVAGLIVIGFRVAGSNGIYFISTACCVTGNYYIQPETISIFCCCRGHCLPLRIEFSFKKS